MNHFEAHIKSLPDKIPVLVSALASHTQGLLQQSEYRKIRRIYLVGCGDSYHASLGANFIFQQLTGTPCWSLTAMTFSRYCSGDLPGDPQKILVVGVSSSGQVSISLSRTTRSASFPASMEPNLSSQKRTFAPLMVYSLIASSRVIFL